MTKNTYPVERCVKSVTCHKRVSWKVDLKQDERQFMWSQRSADSRSGGGKHMG